MTTCNRSYYQTASNLGVIYAKRQGGKEKSSNAYSFGFNGQLKDNEVYGEGNGYTAEFWEYDPRIGRRWNLDPINQVSISNYACFANSPIYFKDSRGNTWDPESQESADAYNKDLDNRISNVESKIESITTELAAIDPASKKFTKLNDQLKNLNDRLIELNIASMEFSVLSQSDQVYSLLPKVKIDHGVLGFPEDEGMIYLGEEGNVIAEYAHGNPAAKGHEIKHLYQYEIGRVSLNEGGAGGAIYDATDEVEAYNRDAVFDGDITSPMIRLTTADIVSHSVYSHLPQVSLTIDTRYNDVYKFNSQYFPFGISVPIEAPNGTYRELHLKDGGRKTYDHFSTTY